MSIDSDKTYGLIGEQVKDLVEKVKNSGGKLYDMPGLNTNGAMTQQTIGAKDIYYWERTA